MVEKVRPAHHVLSVAPHSVVIAEPLPDLELLLRPTALGDIATYTLFSIAGIFLGGEAGVFTGVRAAKRTITEDPEIKARVAKAYRGFRTDVLRKEIELLQHENDDAEILKW